MFIPQIGIIISSQISPEDSDEEQQTDDDTDTEPSEQSASDDSGEEDGLAGVTLNDLDRDDLTPEMQSVYDNLVEQNNNMNAGFTQARQSSAQNLADAERWQTIENDPTLAKAVGDAIYRRDNGLPPVGAAAVEPEPEVMPDQETEPEAYFRALMRQEMQSVLGEVIPGLKEEIGTVSNHVKGQQANFEFTNLVDKYPAAASLGIAKLTAIRNQYPPAAGGAMPLEKAFHLAAMDNPALLATGKKSPSGNTKKPTVVSRPSGGKTGRDNMKMPEGFASLRKAAKASETDGMSMQDRLRGALDKIRAKGEAT